MLTAGIHPKVVSERLGHANIGITLDIYSHVLPGLQEEAADKLPESVLPELSDIRELDLEGTGLVRRLEALRLRYRLAPVTEDEVGETTMQTEIVRIVCSEGL
jgi:hypothetical protein